MLLWHSFTGRYAIVLTTTNKERKKERKKEGRKAHRPFIYRPVLPYTYIRELNFVSRLGVGKMSGT